MENKNIYIEFIGFSCIGKTYLRDKIYEVIESDNKFSVYKRTNKLNAFFNSLKNLKYSDVKVMFDFFYFIRKNRKYSFSKALNRTLAILLRPLQYRKNIKNSIIIVDDGPIGKLSTNGISDKNWLKLLELSRPSTTKYETVYVVLEPPKELYNPKKRIKPPNRKEYLEASFEEKEAMLFNHINKLNEEINFFLTDRSSIDKWIAKEKELIKSKRELK